MALGVLVVLASVLRAANVTCGLLGAWLAASPWLIGYASTTTTGTLNDVLSGLALICLSALQHRRASQHPLADFEPTEPNPTTEKSAPRDRLWLVESRRLQRTQRASDL